MQNIEARGQIINPQTLEADVIHVVAAFIWHPLQRQQFLIARRPKGKHLQDYWELPGGKREVDESPWQALQRELREEINILVDKAEAYMQLFHRYPDRSILLDVWQVKEFSGSVCAMEQQELNWIDINQIHLYRFPAADIPVLEAIKNSVSKEI